ncbi:hypothetical protein WBU86_24185 [Escherichia coli]
MNKQSLSDEYDINWYVSENDPTKTYACLTPELVAALGLKEGIAKACSGRTTMNALNRGN